MPAQETAFRRQKALYWAASGFDSHGEHKRAAESVELDVRWSNAKAKSLDPQGNVIMVDATVTLGQDVLVGSIMWEGSQDDLEEGESGTGVGSDVVPDADLFQVVTFNKMPDLKGRAFTRVAGLKRYGKQMPDSA